MAPAPAATAPFELTGGDPCLDLANTMDNRPDPARRRDLLEGYAHLVAWAEQAGIVTRRHAALLREAAAARPRDAGQVMARIRVLREAIYAAFSSIAAGRRPPAAAVETIEREALDAASHQRLVPEGDGFTWTWAGHAQALEVVLWPVAQTAAALLTSEQRTMVRECAADTCGWLFLDTTRNRSRRWCDMRVCGNRAKARRHYEKVRG